MASDNKGIYYSFVRKRKRPLDLHSLFFSYNDANEYVKNYDLSTSDAYIGQIITVIDEDASSVTIYKIGTDKTLQPIGETGLSEDAVIEILHQNGYITSGSTLELIGKIKADGKTISEQVNTDNNFVTFSVIESALTISSKQVSGLSNDLSSLETTLKEEINNKVSSVYRVKGSCKYGELPEDGQEVGDVWNVTDAHDNTPAGTNFVWTDEGWDPLGGTIDLSPYVKNDDVSAAITSIKVEIQTVQDKLVVANSNIQGLNDKIDGFKTNVENSNKAFTDRIAALDKRISGNTDDIGELSSLTEDLVSSIKDLSESAKTFDESIKTINSSLVSINGEIDTTINHSISELSGKDEQLQSKIDELTEGLNTTNSALTDAVSEIENINEIIETMMNVDASLLQDIQSLSGASTNHEERIEKLERETNTDFVCEKIFSDDENVGFDEFKIEKSGNTVSITLNGFDGGIIELD